MLMRAVEPFAQVRRGFVGGLTVKGHHRCGDARNPDDMGAPAFFSDPRHFNDKGSPGNSSFETMAHDVFFGKWKREAAEILRIVRGETSEGKYEGGARSGVRYDSHRILTKKKFACRVLNRKFTIHQQVFNTPPPSGFGDAGA